MKLKAAALLPVATLALLITAVPASAEIIFLTSGRTLSVKSHAIEGESVILTLFPRLLAITCSSFSRCSSVS